MVDDQIIVPTSLRYAALNTLQFGHYGINKMCSDATIFWWPNMRSEIEKKAETCSACVKAGNNLKSQVQNTKNSKIEYSRNFGEEIQIELATIINSKHLNSSHFILVAEDRNSCCPVATICTIDYHDTEITLLRDYMNI